jgi:hypothetical protein
MLLIQPFRGLNHQLFRGAEQISDGVECSIPEVAWINSDCFSKTGSQQQLSLAACLWVKSGY